MNDTIAEFTSQVTEAKEELNQIAESRKNLEEL
jgi:hypothetical protein